MEEDKLIFLISQPRSGSSMLQQLLINSKEIESAPEWGKRGISGSGLNRISGAGA